MTASTIPPIELVIPNSTMPFAPDHLIPYTTGSLTPLEALSTGSSLLMNIYSIGVEYIRENALDIGMGWLSAEAFDKLSKNNVKLLFLGSKQSEKVFEQFQGKLKKRGSEAAVAILESGTKTPSEVIRDIREGNAAFSGKRLIGGIIHETNQIIQLDQQRKAILQNKLPSKELKEIDAKLKKHNESLPWKVAKLGFLLLVESQCEKDTAKLLKELGTFIFWGKGKPLKNFHAFREALVKSGAIAPLKEGDLAGAIEQIDDKTLSSAGKLGIDVMTYTTAGIKALSLLGAEVPDILSNSAGNILFSLKLGSLLWNQDIASTPNEERSWFVRLFTDHFHSARNERANRLLTRNINPYRT